MIIYLFCLLVIFILYKWINKLAYMTKYVMTKRHIMSVVDK